MSTLSSPATSPSSPSKFLLGINLFSGEIWLFPSSLNPPFSLKVGLPTLPLFFATSRLGSDFPQTSEIISAVAAIMRKCALPEKVAANSGSSGPAARWLETRVKGASELNSPPLKSCWPAPQNSSSISPSEGRLNVPYLKIFCLTTE